VKAKTASHDSDTILIPELEEAMQNHHTRDWSLNEEAILRKYYNRVPISMLQKHLPGRSHGCIRSKAQHMMITTPKKEGMA
jgi:hypothetical protein